LTQKFQAILAVWLRTRCERSKWLLTEWLLTKWLLSCILGESTDGIAFATLPLHMIVIWRWTLALLRQICGIPRDVSYPASDDMVPDSKLNVMIGPQR
jgi:hypothetical protein